MLLKISFLLKRSINNQESLAYITIDSPKKVSKGKLAGKCYSCEVHLPIPGTEKSSHLIYSTNPINAVYDALGFAKSQLQFLLTRGFTISEPETREP